MTASGRPTKLLCGVAATRVRPWSRLLNSGTSTAGSDVSDSGLGSYIYEDIVARVLGPGSYVLGVSFLSENASKDAVAIKVVNITSSSANATFDERRLGPATGANAVFPAEIRGKDR